MTERQWCKVTCSSTGAARIIFLTNQWQWQFDAAIPHDIKTLVQGYLQLNRSSKDHLPNEPGDSSFSKELVITLTGCVRVAALHHAPGVFGKVALQNTLLGNSSQLPCKNLQSNTRKESLRDLIQSSSLTWQSLCVSLPNPLCPAHLTMLLTLDQLSRHQLSSRSVPFCKLQHFHKSRNMGCVGKSLLL